MLVETFHADVDLSHEARGAVCLKKFEVQYRAMADSDLMRVTLDITELCATAIGAASKIKLLRERAAAIAKFDISCIDDLEECAFALSYVNGHYTSSVKPSDDLPILNLEATQTRDRLIAEARSLCASGIIESNSL
jgi:hypothetical protein